MRLSIVVIGVSALGMIQQPVYRSNIEAVAVPVSVYAGHQPVTALDARSFVLEDNGVRQQLSDVTLEPRPLEIVFLLDESASLDRASVAARNRIAAMSSDVGAIRRSGDAVRIRWFAGTTRVDRDAARVRTNANQTAIYDAIAEALLSAPDADFRRTLIVLTDAFDTISSVPPRTVMQLADRSDSTLFVFALAARQENDFVTGFGGDPNTRPPNHRELQDLAERSGGAFEALRPEEDFEQRLLRRLDELRHRYVLRYQPSDLRPGWHTLKVQVTGGRYDISHRRGYWR